MRRLVTKRERGKKLDIVMGTVSVGMDLKRNGVGAMAGGVEGME